MEISVIVPVYKVEPYLRKCVDSILAQTFTDFELVLVDDGSPDNCGLICDEYAEKDSRVRVIHQENGGLSAARNAGLDAARGEYYAFVDSDDWVHPQYLEMLYSALKENSLLISGCNWVEITGKEEVECGLPACQISVKSPAAIFSKPTGNSVYAYIWRYLIHRSLFEGIRFPVGKTWEDVFTTHRVIFRTDKIAHVECGLYFYYRRQDSITKKEWSEKNLFLLDGYRSIIEYFLENPNERMYRCAARGYLFSTVSQFYHVSNSTLSSERKRYYHWKIKWMWIMAVLRYKKASGFSKWDVIEQMKVILPVMYKVYDFFCAVRANLYDRIHGVGK